MAQALTHGYRYRLPSVRDAAGIHLATSAPAGFEQPFLEARLTNPAAIATAMRSVSDVVQSRHHVPAAMLAKILIEADPVITFGDGLLRFEGFSSCCGVYARADILPAGLDIDHARHGSTNVDFNAPMRAALAQVRDTDTLGLEIGSEAFELSDSTREESVIERKVALPLRWLRGFLEVQAVNRRMTPVATLTTAVATRFLRSLPRSGRSSEAAWVVPSGRGLRLGSTERPGAIRVAGLARLRALQNNLRFARSLRVFQDPLTGASSWLLEGDTLRFNLTLSPETWRGFSGEGQALNDLAKPTKSLARVRAALGWQAQIAADQFEDTHADAALALLASEGLLGFDVSESAYFHRVLPFELTETLKQLGTRQPRLKAARTLLEEGRVQRQGTSTLVDGTHTVRLDHEPATCTCTWFAKHKGRRGPCKHVLAAEIHALESAT